MRNLNAILAFCSITAGCAVQLPPESQVNDLLNSGALSSTVLSAVNPPATVPTKHNGAVRVEVDVWTIYVGDGDIPKKDSRPFKEKEGEIYTIWYFKGEKSLEEIRQDPAVGSPSSIFSDSGDMDSNKIGSDNFILYPNADDVTLQVRAYDRDEIGDATYKEVSNFVGNVSSKSSNLYPSHKTVVPVFQDLAALVFLDFPNLFLENDLLGTCKVTIDRDASGVEVFNKTVTNGFLACKITMTKL